MAFEPESFKEVSLKRGDVEVVWEWIGEGMSGDYCADDLEDVPLLRFSIYRIGEQMDNASYCTLLPTDTPEAHLRRAAESILDAVDAGPFYKRRLEELSWFEPSDFQSK